MKRTPALILALALQLAAAVKPTPLQTRPTAQQTRPTAPQTEAVLKVELSSDKHIEFPIRNKCSSTHIFELTKGADTPWLDFIEGPRVQVSPGANKLVVTIDTAGLDVGVYDGQVQVNCIDCSREPGCHITGDAGLSSPYTEIQTFRLRVIWSAAQAQSLQGEQFIAQQILVILNQASSNEINGIVQSLEALYQLRRIKIMQLASISRVAVLFAIISPQLSVAAAIINVQADPRVLFAQPNFIYTTLDSQSEDLRGLQYGLKTIRADVAHMQSSGKGIKVAILDTGVDPDHVSLKGAIVEKKSFVDGDAEFKDVHGTMVAGVIAARPGKGREIRGVAPDAKIMSVKVCKPRSRDSIAADGTSHTLAQGLDFAILKAANIINLSLGGPRDPMITYLVKEATRRRIVLVAAAGNDGPQGHPRYPAAMGKAIAVSAIDIRDELYPMANRGDYIDLVAPGVDIISTQPGNKFNFLTGTSMAAPHVTGVVALILQKRPDLSVAEIKSVMESTARDLGPPGKDNMFGYGCVDAFKSLEALAVADRTRN